MCTIKKANQSKKKVPESKCMGPRKGTFSFKRNAFLPILICYFSLIYKEQERTKTCTINWLNLVFDFLSFLFYFFSNIFLIYFHFLFTLFQTNRKKPSAPEKWVENNWTRIILKKRRKKRKKPFLFVFPLFLIFSFFFHFSHIFFFLSSMYYVLFFSQNTDQYSCIVKRERIKGIVLWASYESNSVKNILVLLYFFLFFYTIEQKLGKMEMLVWFYFCERLFVIFKRLSNQLSLFLSSSYLFYFSVHLLFISLPSLSPSLSIFLFFYFIFLPSHTLKPQFSKLFNKLHIESFFLLLLSPLHSNSKVLFCRLLIMRTVSILVLFFSSLLFLSMF